MDDAGVARWEQEARREVWRWRRLEGDPCQVCGCHVGHFGGDTTRDPCKFIPQDVPLEEVRPNLYTVRRDWIGDAIRSACAKARH